MRSFRIVNAMLYDGSGKEAFEADVTVDNGVIRNVCKAGQTASGLPVIDAAGAALAPGFIDVHSHSDNWIFRVPTADSKISQGCTTEIIGNCGVLEFNGTSTDLDEYAALLEKANPAVNIAALVGFGSLRHRIMGLENRAATKAEIATMRGWLEAALEQGAAGMSSGLWYVPGRYASTEEVCEVASALKGTGKPYATHMRSEGETLLEAIEEAIQIAKAGSGSLQISHFKTYYKDYWHKLDDAIAIIEKYRAEGMDILADRYPYLYSATVLSMILPEPFISDGKLYENLQNDSYQKQILKKFDEMGGPQCPWENVLVIGISDEYPEWLQYRGKTIAEIGMMMGLPPAEACLKILAATKPSTAFGVMCEENLQKILSKDWVIMGSDCECEPFDTPICHPRSFGTSGRFFRKAVAFNSPEKVIYRMTALPARKFNLRDRGLIAEGYAADMVLFDMDCLNAKEDYLHPATPAEGIRKVFVNGILAYEPGREIRRAGQFLRVKK